MPKYLYLSDKIISILSGALNFYKSSGFNLPLYIKLIIEG